MQNLGRTGRLVELFAGTLEFGMHHPRRKYVCYIPCREREGNQEHATNWSRGTMASQSLGERAVGARSVTTDAYSIHHN
jgi:hypothetical protein